MSQSPPNELPTGYRPDDSIEIPDPDTILNVMEFLLDPDRELGDTQQHAAWDYSRRLAETPFPPDQQETANAIIRTTYERLINSSNVRFLKYCRTQFAQGYGKAMMHRDGVQEGRPVHPADQIRYFLDRLYPDGEPKFPGKV